MVGMVECMPKADDMAGAAAEAGTAGARCGSGSSPGV